MEELPDDWTTTAKVVRDTARKVLGVSSKQRKEDKETWWWNEEVPKSIRRKDWRRRGGICREMKRVKNSIRRCDERRRRRWRRPRTMHMMSCMRSWTLRKDEGHCTEAGKDVQQVRMIDDTDGKVMTDEESVLIVWKEYYKGLMNGENERERRENDGERVNLEVEKISKEEVRENMKRMKNGKAVGPDDIPARGRLEMSRIYCTGVPYETVQQNDGK